MKADAIAKMATQLRENYQQTVRDFLDLQVRGSLEGASVIEQLRNALFVHGEAKPEALEAGLGTLAISDLRPTLPHVRTRTLVIAGQNDRITAPAASRALAEALPDAQYVEMRRAAHTPFLSHRKEFAAILQRFLLAAAQEASAVPTPATRAAAALASAVPTPATRAAAALAGASESVAAPVARSGGGAGAASRPTTKPVGPVGKAAARPATSVAPSGATTSGRAKKKRMKARARKKLQASSR
jgi:hypothetical protein